MEFLDRIMFADTTLASLPTGLAIGGDLNIDGCVSLTGLSDDMDIRGEIYGREDLERPPQARTGAFEP